jgi:hypothetical protein
MESLSEYMNEYRKQLQKGEIQKAYKGLLEYIMDLRTQFSKKFPDFTPGNIYHGYMDMTYFPIFPESLKSRKLKIAIVFNYDRFRFEVWLAGYNKTVQDRYWKLFKENEWEKYCIVSTTHGVDSIVEHVLADNLDFNDLDSLTKKIEAGTLNFIGDIEDFFSRLNPA